MLERLFGNDALKRDLSAALQSGRLAHSILLIGEPGCGAGFAARCLAADYLYPAGGPHAEAVLRGEAPQEAEAPLEELPPEEEEKKAPSALDIALGRATGKAEEPAS